jgi:hydroxyacylglutathione hydrolase
MQIKQWDDKNLAQYSYGILSEKKAVLIDPSRNPQPYFDWAKENDATIIGIIETHPHADFISSHLELHELTGATIYVHSLVGVSYPHQPFDDGQVLEFGKTRLISMHTPGHSPDSISILLAYDGKQKAVFTGDTLFIGDCGRPDLREGAGNIQAKREDLAKQMYHSLRSKLIKLDEDVLVYPAHGAGTLCGKNLSKESSSTIGKEKETNWSLQEATEEEFVRNLLSDQPFIPAYFPYDVEINRKGAPTLATSISNIKSTRTINGASPADIDRSLWIIDPRDEKIFKQGHMPHSINLMETGKFETWLGTIIKPGESFYLVGESKEQLQRLFERTAAIGYESQIKEAFILEMALIAEPQLDTREFKTNTNNYTIVDVRNISEVREGKIFSDSIAIPLAELRERINEIPTNRPIVVHCAGGYRSAAASSMIRSSINGKTKVYDLGDRVKQFIRAEVLS